MAIFHIDFKILKRSEGKSSLYLAAYNARTRLKDEKTGLVFNYEKKKEDLIHHDILLPPNAPKSFLNRSVLWNSAEFAESRRDSQISRYFIVALCRELSLEENKKLLEEYIKKNFIKKGMCADYAIHNDADNNNPHAHVMLTMREIENDGFSKKKNRDWNKKENMEIWRRSWSVSVNKFLRENKKSDYVTHLSFLKQRELLIQKANESLDNNKIEDAEKYINAYNDFKHKKPKKRKPRKTYIKRKNLRSYTYEQQAEENKIRKEKKKEEMKKENLINSFFKNILNKLTAKSRERNEREERRKREIKAMKDWQEKEEMRSEIKNEKQRIKEENNDLLIKNEGLNNDKNIYTANNKRRANIKQSKDFTM